MDLRLYINKKSARVIVISIIIAIGVVVIVMVNTVGTNSINFSSSPSSNTNLLGKGNSSPSLSLLIGHSNAQKEELQKRIIPLDQIVSGGPPPDGIPSIDNPRFVTVQEADKNFL